MTLRPSRLRRELSRTFHVSHLTFWFLLLGAAVLWRLKNIDAFGLANDEGAYLMWARLVAEGYPLYTQTYSGAPPLFIEMLALVFKVFGFSIVSGRLVVLAWFVILAGLLAYLSRQIAGWPGAYISLVMVAFITPLFTLSRQVMIEIPAMALAVAAVGCGYLFFAQKPFWRWDRAWWLMLAGLFLALSLLMKLLYPLAVAPILYFIWRDASSFTNRLKYSLLFGLSGLIIVLVTVSFYDVNAFLDQAIRFRAETRDLEALPLAGNGQRLVAYSGSLWGLSLLTLAGLFVLPWQTLPGQKRGLAWALWFLANLALLLWYYPLFPHHFTIILPAAILLSVEFVAFCQTSSLHVSRFTFHVSRFTFHVSRFTFHASRFTFHAGWAIVLITLLNLVSLFRANQAVVTVTTGGREAEAAKILAQVTRPTDFVMSDSQLLALLADRLTPPPLVDFSLVYIQSGRQTPERLIRLSNEYPVTAVASWALRMVWLPDYLAWAAENYWVRKAWDNDHILYFGPKHPAGHPIPNEQSLHFTQRARCGEDLVREDGIIFSGYRLDTKEVKAGVDLSLTLYWQTTRPLQTDYTIFVQVLNEAGVLVAQNDSQPLYGYFPTSQWPPEEIIPDRLTIPLPADLPPGVYTVIAGMYRLETLTRLAVAETGQDHIVVMAFTIE